MCMYVPAYKLMCVYGMRVCVVGMDMCKRACMHVRIYSRVYACSMHAYRHARRYVCLMYACIY